MKRPFPKLATAMMLCGLYGSVFALGFGRLSPTAVLGQPLNLTIPVRLEPGEDLNPTCVVADVYFGDGKLLPDVVQVRVEGQPHVVSERTLRVLTSVRVNEPVVTVYLAAGCQSKVTRKFVAFADPPLVAEPPVVAPSLEGPIGAASPQPGAVAAAVDASTATAAIPAAAASAPSRRVSRPVSRPSPASVSASASVSAPLAVSGLDTRGDRIAAKGKRRSPSRARKPVGDQALAGGDRLMLDPIESEALIEPTLRLSSELSRVDDDSGADGTAVRQRREAAAALWRALNASPEQMAQDRQRLQELEARLARMQSEGNAAQAQIALLQQQVVRAQQKQQRGHGLGYLFAALSTALAVALGWMLVRQRREARAWWQQEQAAQASRGGSEATPSRLMSASSSTAQPHEFAPSGTDLAMGLSAASLLKTVDAADLPATGLAADQPEHIDRPELRSGVKPQALSGSSSQPLAAVATPAKPVLREVSVEELIDLEQQAEFFMVLGQDDAAIDLLEGHIDGTEGTSPLPYLKLLELYQRLGNREAYERIRERFNTRFNAYAPEWDADLQQGHALGDYPGVIERLQALWDSPEQAMEVLQASLLRHDPVADTFDLPAYRELLFLYSVARDLWEHCGERVAARAAIHPSAAVDVLLPFANEPNTPAVEPLVATRPNKPFVSSRSAPLQVDVTLDEVVDPSEVNAASAGDTPRA